MIYKPSILLTGGSGLLAVNWYATQKDKYLVYLGINKRKIEPVEGNVINLDFSSSDLLSKQLEIISPKIVIHTAGLTNVEECEYHPELAFKINVELSKMIALVTKSLGIPLVHISTDHLFEGNIPMLSELEPTNAINVYGKTKAIAEKAISQINPDALIIRTNFFCWGTTYRKSFSDFIIKSLRENKELKLFNDVFYTPILAEKLIQTVHDLIAKKAKGIFNIVSDDRLSKYEFGLLIAEEFGLNKSLIQECSFHSQKKMVNRPCDMSLSNIKVCKFLGRNLGTVQQFIALLHKQENNASIKEIQLL